MASKSFGFSDRPLGDMLFAISSIGAGGICGVRPESLEFIFDQLSMRYPWMN
jgi:hypothetical protein